MIRGILLGQFLKNIDDICKQVLQGEEITLAYSRAETKIGIIKQLKDGEADIDPSVRFSISDINYIGQIKSLRLQTLYNLLTDNPILFVHDRKSVDKIPPISGTHGKCLMAIESLVYKP